MRMVVGAGTVGAMDDDDDNEDDSKDDGGGNDGVSDDDDDVAFLERAFRSRKCLLALYLCTNRCAQTKFYEPRGLMDWDLRGVELQVV